MPTTVPPLRILLVEDDDAYAGLVDTELSAERVSAKLQRSRTLTEASGLLPQDQFDVVLLDLGLPDSSGLETLRRMQEAAAEIPIVVLTGENSDALAIAAVQSGAEDYLIKSSTNGQLLVRALRYACERAASRQALRRSEEQLRQAQKMEAVGRLAGGVAHDFNNLLTAIFGYSDLLIDQFERDDPRRADIVEIRRSAERAAALTRQLLAFSRKQILQPRIVNLNDVITELRKLLSRLLGEHILIAVDLAPNLWDVRADAGQIEQVVINLCANARDAMPEGGRIQISTENVVITGEQAVSAAELADGSYVKLTIADEGHGMAATVRHHIFEPFFTTKEQGKGTGLGLATAYGIVKQSEGEILVESEEGRGSTFFVYLPRAVPPGIT